MGESRAPDQITASAAKAATLSRVFVDNAATRAPDTATIGRTLDLCRVSFAGTAGKVGGTARFLWLTGDLCSPLEGCCPLFCGAGPLFVQPRRSKARTEHLPFVGGLK